MIRSQDQYATGVAYERSDIQRCWYALYQDILAKYGPSLPGAVPDHATTVSVDDVTLALPALARQFNVFLASGDAHVLTQSDLYDQFPLIRTLMVISISFVLTKHSWLFPWVPGRAPDFRARIDLHLSESTTATIVRDLRQLLSLYSRLTVRDGLLKSDEETLEAAKLRLTAHPSIYLSPMCRFVMTTVMSSFKSYEVLRNWNDEVFRHGPGAVSEGLRPSEKGLVRRYIDPLTSYLSENFSEFPFESQPAVVFPGHLVYPQFIHGNSFSSVDLVPKDYRGKRVIASEPLLHQYVQEGFADCLVKYIQHGPLRNVCVFEKDIINRHRALSGSRLQVLATLDLSDASDTVRIDHVKFLFKDLPVLLQDLEAVRTRQCQIGSSVVEDVTTMYTMGAALCFPLETLCYSVILIGSLWSDVNDARVPFTSRTIARTAKALGLTVFGDDIIIKRRYAKKAIDVLIGAGMSPNRDKCCFRTHFLESCGCDALHGYDITPLRPRLMPGACKCSPESLLSTISNFAKRRYDQLCLTLIDIAGRLRWLVPIVPERVEWATAPGVVCSDFLYALADQKAKLKPLISRPRKGGAAYNLGYPYSHTKVKCEGIGSWRHLFDSLSRNRGDEPCTPFAGYPASPAGFVKTAYATIRGPNHPYMISRARLRILNCTDPVG